ncbi:peptidase S1 [Chromatium weissei]|nr:peptidase S1 [Chromatium weissei]
MREFKTLYWRWLLALLWTSPSWALLGGQTDTPDEFGAVVALVRDNALHCSATKISQQAFLTAAHCVASTRTGTLDSAFVAGQSLVISAAPAPKTRNDFIKLTINRTQLHSDYAAALHRFFVYKSQRIAAYQQRYSGEDLARRIRVLEADNHFTARFPDLAVVVVRESTPLIPIAPVDCTPLLAGTKVQLVGYGYDSIKHFAQRRKAAPFGQRHWGTTEVIRIDSINFYTYGGLLRAGEPSLSPGDSGGPVLRRGRVVGVNGTVYGLSRLDAARSNMAVNLNGLNAPAANSSGQQCRAFFRDF